MLSRFTWTQFTIVMAVATAIWVLYTLRHQLLGKRSHSGGNGKTSPQKRVWQPPDQDKEHSPPPSESTSHPAGENHRFLPMDLDYQTSERVPLLLEDEDIDHVALENLALEISELTPSLGIATTEEHLFMAIRNTLSRYPTLTSDAHRQAINHLIVRCAIKDCGYVVSLEQAASLWPGVRGYNQ